MTAPTHLFAASGYEHPYRTIQPYQPSTTNNKENNQ